MFEVRDIVECIDSSDALGLLSMGGWYEVLDVQHESVKGVAMLQLECDKGHERWYYASRFKLVKTPPKAVIEVMY